MPEREVSYEPLPDSGCDDDELAEMSTMRMLGVSLSSVPIEFGWGIGEGLMMPLLKGLGTTEAVASLVWLLNPMFGFPLQPIVGRLTDNSQSKFGRRRIWIVTLCLGCLAGMLCLSFTDRVSEHTSRMFAIVFAFASFGIMDLCHDLMIIPSRALMTDLTPPSQKEIGNSYLSIMSSIGRCLAYVIGGVALERMSVFSWLGTHLRASLFVAAVVLITCTVLCVIAGKENPNIQKTHEQDAGILATFREAKKLPRSFLFVWTVQMMGWMLLMVQSFFMTLWCGEVIFGGVAPSVEDSSGDWTEDNNRFQDGLLFGMQVMAAGAAFMALFSFAIPKINEFAGVGFVYFLGHLLYAVCCGLFFLIDSQDSKIWLWPAAVVFGLQSTVMNANGYLMMGDIAEETPENAGAVAGMMVASLPIGQILTAIYTFVAQMALQVSVQYIFIAPSLVLAALSIAGFVWVYNRHKQSIDTSYRSSAYISLSDEPASNHAAFVPIARASPSSIN